MNRRPGAITAGNGEAGADPAVAGRSQVGDQILAAAQSLGQRRWAAYLVAILLTLIGFGLKSLFAQALQPFPLLVATMVVTLVAFLGGRGPAILSAILSELSAQYQLLTPFDADAFASSSLYIGIAFYAGLCALIIVLMHGMLSANIALRSSRAALQTFNAELETRIAERTAKLMEAQKDLRETNRNLEGLVEARVGDLKLANEEIQRFAYIVSHDLRAPLVNVLGFTSELDAASGELLAFLRAVEASAPHLITPERRMAIETDLPEALGFIRSSTRKMDRLINAILRLSREGGRRLVAEQIDMAALARAQGETLAQQLSAKLAELIVADDVPPLRSDRLAVEQIFGNLIENAVKYIAPERPGRIVVSGRLEGSMIRYEIADNGRGIEAKDFERIFDLFRRSGEQNTPGEGIGLATVRNLARRLGGSVSVASEVGRGSTFAVMLPAVFRSDSKREAAA